mgnify:CR=1 FL=1
MVDIMARMKERTPHEVLEPRPGGQRALRARGTPVRPSAVYAARSGDHRYFEEAKGIKRFTVRYRDRPNQGRPALRGQFFMLTVFGAGEIAISVPFSDRVKDAFTFYVKKVARSPRPCTT